MQPSVPVCILLRLHTGYEKMLLVSERHTNIFSTHREMIPGGKLFGIALVSTQKALSLVQEQVAGQRGILGALLAFDSLGRQRNRHKTNKPISLSHLGPSSNILGQAEMGICVTELLEVSVSGKWLVERRWSHCLQHQQI